MPRMASRKALIAAAAATAAAGLLRPHLADLPLSYWPILQTHDTGTVYLQPTNEIDEIIYRFTRTQNAQNVTGLLNCGARAFDWRPELNGNTLGFFHGPVFINHSMSAATQEVIDWANAHAAEQEDALVLIMAVDCGDACAAATAAAFQALGVPLLTGTEGCATASDLTVQAAMDASKLAGGGHVLATLNCPSSSTNTYDETLSCTGFLGLDGDAHAAAARRARFTAAWHSCGRASTDEAGLRACLLAKLELPAAPTEAGACPELPDVYACYTDAFCGRNATYASDRLKAFNVQVTSVAPPSAAGQRGLLTSMQGCWAQNDISTVLSFLYNSSLILDDVRANFNLVTLPGWLNVNPKIPRTLQYVNLVGVNNVCDNGPNLAAILKMRL